MGALLITIPNDLSGLNNEDKRAFLELETELSSFDTDQAVYLVEESEELKDMISHVAATGGKAPTAAQQLVNSIVSNNYFLTSNVNAVPPVVAAKQFNVITSLTSGDAKSPTIVFCAHYDSAGLAPGYAVQADSNGSGVAALLELYAALRRFYSKGSRPRYNLVFALTAGGKYNYQGARHYIENLNEKEDIELAICLDSLGNGEELYMQVAKDPKEDSIVTRVFNRVSNGLPKNRTIEIVKKKINTAAETLAWEHEMFLMKKRQAVTFTHFKDHKDPMKESLLDTKNNINMDSFYWNVK
uniref:BOS complex subunit NCLN n=1 Tax=Panagrolaimus sp. JU765 TaxID=591449 RepID=A0AC34R3Y9_9BILA